MEDGIMEPLFKLSVGKTIKQSRLISRFTLKREIKKIKMDIFMALLIPSR